MSDLPVPTVDPEEVRLEAERILDRPEFADDRNLIERGVDWIVEQLSRLFPDGAPGGGGLNSLVVLLLVAVGVWLLVVGVRALVRLRREGRATAGPGLAVVLGEAFDPSELERTALDAESAGDWATALIARYRLMVARLVGANVLSANPGRTTGEYRAEMAEARPEVTAPFAESTAMFEDAYYGALDVERSDLERLRLQSEQILGVLVSGR